jgi:hypothetical protein
MTAASLTDRYIYAVQRSLPEAQRADIDRELRATIADTIDAKIEAGSKPVDAERETLAELGDPYKLAWGYADRPLHLIGPALFPDYIRLLRLLYFVVLPIVVVVVFLSLLLAKSLEGESLWEAVGAIWAVAFGIAVHMGFWTTLVFAVLERTQPKSRPITTWDPSLLPQIPVKGTIRALDTGAALVWLTLYVAAIIGQQFFSPLLDAAGDPLPLINPELWSFWLPYFIGLAVLEAVFAIVLYRTRHWTVPLAIVNTVLALAFTIPAMLLLWAGEVMNPAFAERLDLTAIFGAGGVVTIVLVFVTGVIAAADIIDGFVRAIRGQGSWPELPDLEELAHLGELGNLRKPRKR